mmetsp:Transcript_33870/g.95919  ORF Transcript_33870/g.95919 Transcript_33870/m.95919 type:complete len:157 (-) Transcript_33870:1599-2069(-)
MTVLGGPSSPMSRDGIASLCIGQLDWQHTANKSECLPAFPRQAFKEALHLKWNLVQGTCSPAPSSCTKSFSLEQDHRSGLHASSQYELFDIIDLPLPGLLEGPSRLQNLRICAELVMRELLAADLTSLAGKRRVVDVGLQAAVVVHMTAGQSLGEH